MEDEGSQGRHRNHEIRSRKRLHWWHRSRVWNTIFTGLTAVATAILTGLALWTVRPIYQYARLQERYAQLEGDYAKTEKMRNQAERDLETARSQLKDVEQDLQRAKLDLSSTRQQNQMYEDANRKLVTLNHQQTQERDRLGRAIDDAIQERMNLQNQIAILEREKSEKEESRKAYMKNMQIYTARSIANIVKLKTKKYPFNQHRLETDLGVLGEIIDISRYDGIDLLDGHGPDDLIEQISKLDYTGKYFIEEELKAIGLLLDYEQKRKLEENIKEFVKRDGFTFTVRLIPEAKKPYESYEYQSDDQWADQIEEFSAAIEKMNVDRHRLHESLDGLIEYLLTNF